MSRPGSQAIPTTPSGCNRGARWPTRCMRVTTPSPTSRCRGGSISNGWCAQPRKWMYGAIAATLLAFIAGGGVGWLAHGAAAAPSLFQRFTVEALDAHRLYVVEVRHPVEVPGSERAHLQTWLTKRCGWVVRAPELGATGLKLVGGRLLPGPTGPASFLMYESASGERFTVYTAKADAETTQMRYATAGQGRRAVLGRSRRGLCGQRRQRPRAPDPGGAAGLRRQREERRIDSDIMRCPNSDTENLESSHRRVSNSHRVITRS